MLKTSFSDSVARKSEQIALPWLEENEETAQPGARVRNSGPTPQIGMPTDNHHHLPHMTQSKTSEKRCRLPLLLNITAISKAPVVIPTNNTEISRTETPYVSPHAVRGFAALTVGFRDQDRRDLTQNPPKPCENRANFLVRRNKKLRTTEKPQKV